MSRDQTEIDVRVNFGRPMPVFAIDQLVVLPQQVVPLHIFEKRYRQMDDHSLDGAGQIAMALFEPGSPGGGVPPLRRAVCVGQIAQHEKLPDGRYNILLQGVCRARIVEEQPPEGGRLYPQALLRPVGTAPADEDDLAALRVWITDEIDRGALSRLTPADDLLRFIRNEDIPSSTVIEVISFTLVQDTEKRYRLLAEPEAPTRAALLKAELSELSRLIRLAERQHPESWPKGVSWN